MFFEHKKSPVIHPRKFALRMVKYFLITVGLLLFSVIIGMLGYHHYGQMSWLDAFYNACMILTGMGPVAVMNTAAGKMFASIYALYSGVAFLTTVAVFLSPIAHRFLHVLHVDDGKEG